VSLRSGLLAGRRLALAGEGPALSERLQGLGAGVEAMDGPSSDDEEQAAAWVADRGTLDALVYDAREAFGTGGHEGLRVALDGAWITARAVSTGALIPAEGGGRLVFVAPSADAGPLAEAARAGLESLARTVSVEWARHTVTAVAVCPGADTTEDEVADLVAFLLSAAGGYFSGCRFDLGLIGASRSPVS
jgi:NAD(P)-dependent dehydrogenase (short-subunit alcohol dehydrogenase family)